MLAPHERLPEYEKPEVREHQTARPEVLRAPHRGKVQGRMNNWEAWSAVVVAMLGVI